MVAPKSELAEYYIIGQIGVEVYWFTRTVVTCWPDPRIDLTLPACPNFEVEHWKTLLTLGYDYDESSMFHMVIDHELGHTWLAVMEDGKANVGSATLRCAALAASAAKACPNPNLHSTEEQRVLDHQKLWLVEYGLSPHNRPWSSSRVSRNEYYDFTESFADASAGSAPG